MPVSSLCPAATEATRTTHDDIVYRALDGYPSVGSWRWHGDDGFELETARCGAIGSSTAGSGASSPGTRTLFCPRATS